MWKPGDRLYWIEAKRHYGFRYCSYYNGARGSWHEEWDDADLEGEVHQAIIEYAHGLSVPE